ncbi:MAG: hypothetical protein FWH57_09430 [Oscillospiraceae bacterium]|nr:hypothetical protein [Oscillospiraceae bacterium]
MNIYEYLTSPDIAAHCEKIGHVFNPLEMAVIVQLSNKPIKDKHIAWREIIADYPDMPIHESVNFKARDSLHDYLREFIALEEKAIEHFMSPGKNTIYRYAVNLRSILDNEIVDEWYSGVYSTYENLWAAFCEHWDVVDDRVTDVKIIKHTLDSDEDFGMLVDLSGNTLDLYYEFYNGIDILDMVFIHVPVPFEKGDLVTTYDKGIGHPNGRPQVLDWIPQWRGSRHPYEDYLSGKHGDGSDNVAQCYYFDNGHLILDYAIYGTLCLQYFKGELEGRERFLKYLSKYIKSQDDNLDWILNVYYKFRMEEESEKANSLFDGWYWSLEKEDSIE